MMTFKQFVELANNVSTVADKVPSGDRKPELLSGGEETGEPGPMKPSTRTSAFPVYSLPKMKKLKK